MPCFASIKEMLFIFKCISIWTKEKTLVDHGPPLNTLHDQIFIHMTTFQNKVLKWEVVEKVV